MKIENKIVIWSLGPLGRGSKIKIWFKDNQWPRHSEFTLPTNYSNEEIKDHMYDLESFYHVGHNFKFTFRKLGTNFSKEQKMEWEDFCDGRTCQLIYLRDYLVVAVERIMKIKKFIWRIRI